MVGMSRLVNGRSARPGFVTEATAPEHSTLAAELALAISTDRDAGRTFLSADPSLASDADLDSIEVLGTEPVPIAR
jgi:hypothetical protein